MMVVVRVMLDELREDASTVGSMDLVVMGRHLVVMVMLG